MAEKLTKLQIIRDLINDEICEPSNPHYQDDAECLFTLTDGSTEFMMFLGEIILNEGDQETVEEIMQEIKSELEKRKKAIDAALFALDVVAVIFENQ